MFRNDLREKNQPLCHYMKRCCEENCTWVTLNPGLTNAQRRWPMSVAVQCLGVRGDAHYLKWLNNGSPIKPLFEVTNVSQDHSRN